MSLKYLSVCSGIEAATCAWHPMGWEAVAFSEIEPFPSAVLAHHYPDTPNLGDMTKFAAWPDYAIDILVGGSPCQSFSVAGLRKGLEDPRGNLMLTYLAIAARYRPRWICWENVPGVLSSNGGKDFGALLGGLAELGYGFAYRILDAQYVRVESHPRAVPQRRRRVFVVGYLGDWRRAAAVLFERESLRGDSPPRRISWKSVAPTLASRARGGGGLGTDFDCDGGLIARDVAHAVECHAAKGGDPTTDNYVARALRGEGFDVSEDGTGRGTPLVAFSCKDHGTDAGEVSPTLRGMGHDGSHANGGGQVAIAIGIDGGEVAFALRADASHSGDKGDGGMNTTTVATTHAVRRLTPRECERLQGFPDDYTAIPWRRKAASKCPDGPRYKSLGNSMAVNCMRWIGQRIAQVEAIP